MGPGAKPGNPLEAVFLGALDDPGHRFHRFGRPLADARLPRKHDGVGAVKDGVGAVADLGAGRSGVFDHRLEHLCGHDHGFGVAPGHLDGELLDQGDLLERELDPQVTTRDHHGVERVDDLPEVLDGLGLLDLGDHGKVDTLLVHDLVHPLDVFGVTNEGQGNHVRGQSQGPAQVRLVLFRQGRHADSHPWQIDALVVGNDPAAHYLAGDVGVSNLERPERDLAVIDQQRVARLHVPGKTFVGRRHTFLVALDVIDRDGESFAVDQRHRTVGETAGANLGALPVDHYAHCPARFLAGLTDLGKGRLVLFVAAVGPVDPGDVHARINERPYPPWDGCCRAKGADDLRAAHDHDSIGRLSALVNRVAVGTHTLSGESVAFTGRGSAENPPIRKASTPAAAERPSAMAHTISDWPRPASPATKTPGTDVMKALSRLMFERSSSSTPSCSTTPLVCGPRKPMASRTSCAGISRALPSTSVKPGVPSTPCATSTRCRARTLPCSSPRISLVFTA